MVLRPRRTFDLRRKQQGFIGIGIRNAIGGGGGGGPTINPGGGWSFFAPLQTTLRPSIAQGSYTPTYSRASIATVRDFENRIITVDSGEARFEGARRVKNIFTGNTHRLSGGTWSQSINGTGLAPTVTPDFAIAPDGSQTASRFQMSLNGGTTTNDRVWWQHTTPASVPRGFAIYAKANSGSPTVHFRVGGTVAHKVLTADWQRIFVYADASDADASCLFGIRGGQVPTNSDTADILVWGGLAENMTGQSNRNPSEYVSVGVLAAPYHGAGVDGVKYFDTENGNAVASNVVTERAGRPLEGFRWAHLPGAVGSYLSAPDSQTNSVTGNIDIRVRAALADWSNGTTQTFISKDALGSRGWGFRITATGFLDFYFSADGAVVTDDDISPAAVAFADLEDGWIRVTRIASTGSLAFYTSKDYDPITASGTWVLLGEVAQTAGNIFDSTSTLDVGARLTGANDPAAGRVLYAEVRNGINGTVVARFDPREWSTGSAWVSSTGETWTLNGGAAIVVPPVDAKGPFGYRSEPSRVNRCTNGETTGAVAGSPGTLPTGWSVSGAGIGGLTRTIAIGTDPETGRNYVEIRYNGTSAGGAINVIFAGSAFAAAQNDVWTVAADLTLVAGSTTNLSNWAYSIDQGNPGFLGSNAAAITAPGARRARISAAVTLTQVGTTQINAHCFQVAAAAAAVDFTIRFSAAQTELGAWATSYIPTTTVAVTRNQDLLTFPSASNALTTAGTVYFEGAIDSLAEPLGSTGVSIDDGSANNTVELAYGGAGGGQSCQAVVRSGGGIQMNDSVGADVVGTVARRAMRWAANSGRGAFNGTLSTGDAVLTVPAGSFTTIRIGERLISTMPWGGTLRHVGIRPRAEQDAWLQSQTA